MVQLIMELFLILYIPVVTYFAIKSSLEVEFLKDELYNVQIDEIR